MVPYRRTLFIQPINKRFIGFTAQIMSVKFIILASSEKPQAPFLKPFQNLEFFLPQRGVPKVKFRAELKILSPVPASPVLSLPSPKDAAPREASCLKASPKVKARVPREITGNKHRSSIERALSAHQFH